MTHREFKNDRSLATGIIDPVNELVFTINTDPSKFDHTAGKLQIIDTTLPNNPLVTIIDVPARTGISVDNIGTQAGTFVALDSNGEVDQQSTLLGGAYIRNNAIATILSHGGGTEITDSSNFITVSLSSAQMSFADISQAIGPVTTQEGGRNRITGSATNTKLNKADGSYYGHAFNAREDNQNPNFKETAALNEPDMFTSWTTSDSAGGKIIVSTTGIEAGIFDDGTAVVADASPQGVVGDDEWVNNRVFTIVDSNQLAMQYGSRVYPTAIAARLGLQTEDFEVLSQFQATEARSTVTMRGNSPNLGEDQYRTIAQASGVRSIFI